MFKDLLIRHVSMNTQFFPGQDSFKPLFYQVNIIVAFTSSSNP